MEVCGCKLARGYEAVSGAERSRPDCTNSSTVERAAHSEENATHRWPSDLANGRDESLFRSREAFVANTTD
jgi:hypothetical protein